MQRCNKRNEPEPKASAAVAKILKEARKKSELTQEEAAMASSFDVRTIQRHENREIEVAPENLEAYAAVYRDPPLPNRCFATTDLYPYCMPKTQFDDIKLSATVLLDALWSLNEDLNQRLLLKVAVTGSLEGCIAKEWKQLRPVIAKMAASCHELLAHDKGFKGGRDK